jgi:hypothetical protein
MTSKKVLTQMRKAVQLVQKEGWPTDAATEATHTSISDEISLEEYFAMVEEELGGIYA